MKTGLADTSMGDRQSGDLRVCFDGRLKLTLLGSQITTDAGLLAYRELDEALTLTDMAADGLQDSRLGKNKQHILLPHRLRRNEYLETSRGRHPLLQRAWHSGAVDHRGQVRSQVDAPFVQALCRQPSSPATVRSGLQPSQLPQASGVASRC